MTMWMSRSAGTFASTRSSNLRNSRARWRGKHLPMISPVAMSTKREVRCRGACSRGCASSALARGAPASRGWERSQGLDLALFSTQRTRARSGGAKYRPTMSRTISTKKGSLDSLKVSERCKPYAMTWSRAYDSPIPRTDPPTRRAGRIVSALASTTDTFRPRPHFQILALPIFYFEVAGATIVSTFALPDHAVRESLHICWRDLDFLKPLCQ